MKALSSNKISNLTSTQILMLQSCLSKTKEECVDLLREWDETVDIADLEYSSSRLVPFFLFRLNSFNLLSKHDNRLKIIYKHWWLRSKHIVYQLEIVIAALTKANIEVIVVKGASIKLHYASEELRTMSDMDVLIHSENLDAAMGILKKLDFEFDAILENLGNRSRKKFMNFDHATTAKHLISGTNLDLHWRLGSFCSNELTNSLWGNLNPYKDIKLCYRPSLSLEVFMILIHASSSNNKDNLNWIIDVDVINSQYDLFFWEEVKQFAIKERKEDLFYDACTTLLKFGVYAPQPPHFTKRREFIFSDTQKMNFLSLIYSKVSNVIFAINSLHPHKGIVFKIREFLNFIHFYADYRFNKLRK